MQPANNASKSTNKSIGPITKKKIVLGRGKETPTKNEIKNKGSYDNFKKDFQWNAGQTFSSQPGLYSQQPMASIKPNLQKPKAILGENSPGPRQPLKVY